MYVDWLKGHRANTKKRYLIQNMLSSPINFSKSAVNKLLELQDRANVPLSALLCIEVDGLNPDNELIYEFVYKNELQKDEKVYKSNGFPYMLTDFSAVMMNNATIDYSSGHFEIDLGSELEFCEIGIA